MHMTSVFGQNPSLATSILSVALDLDLSYIANTNFSRILWSSSPITGGYWLSFLKKKTVDASGHTFHVCHALFFPLPRNADTTSQPVKAWKNRRLFDFSGPIEGLISCMGIHFKLCPWPKATHSFSTPRSCRIGRPLTAMTRTAGFNYNIFVTVCCSVFWMQEDSCVCFLVIAVSKSFKTYWLIADNTLFLSDYNCIIRTHLYNYICQKVE